MMAYEYAQLKLSVDGTWRSRFECRFEGVGEQFGGE